MVFSVHTRFTKVGDSAINSLQQIQLPPNSTYVTHDSSAFHSWSFFKMYLHWEWIKGCQSLQTFPTEAIDRTYSLNSALPLKDSYPPRVSSPTVLSSPPPPPMKEDCQHYNNAGKRVKSTPLQKKIGKTVIPQLIFFSGTPTSTTLYKAGVNTLIF